MSKSLAIENEYGNVDLTITGLSSRYQHIRGQRLQPLCRKLGIKYAEAVVGFVGDRRYGFRPRKDGVVVSSQSADKLRALIDERDARAKINAEKKKQRDANKKPVSVLAALFTINRRAKRCRDSAQRYYLNGMHGFAKKMRREKESAYDIKGQVLHYLVADGQLTHDSYHRLDGGNWAEVLVGDGYRFHRPCGEPDPRPEIDEMNSIEAKPKGRKEPTLAEANEILTAYLNGRPVVDVYQWPARVRPTRYRWDDDDDDIDMYESEEEWLYQYQ